MNYLVSCDWFQYFCHRDLSVCLDAGTYHKGLVKNPSGIIPMYKVEDGIEYHPIYREARCVRLHGFTLAHIFFRPKSSALDPKSASIKVNNRALYSSTWAHYLKDICDALSFEIRSLTRADICIDFQEFCNGETPKQFIEKYLRDGDTDVDTYSRRGSNKFAVYGKKEYFSDSGSVKNNISGTKTSYEYLRFGTRNSGVCTYLYNKSKELHDKHSKPWIQDAWKEVCLIPTADRPVYRLEFSIQAKGIYVTENLLGDSTIKLSDLNDIRQLTASDFDTQLKLEQLFASYAQRYFCFYMTKGKTKRHDMEQVKLFDLHAQPTLLPKSICKSWDTGVSERRVAKVLERVARQFPNLDPSSVNKLVDVSNILFRLGIVKGEHVERLMDETMLRELKGGKTLDEMVLKGVMSSKNAIFMRDLLRKKWNEFISPFLDNKKFMDAMHEADEEQCLVETVIADLARMSTNKDFWQSYYRDDITKYEHYMCPF